MLTTASLQRRQATLWLDSRSSAMTSSVFESARRVMSAGSTSLPNACRSDWQAARATGPALESTLPVPITARAIFCSR